MTGRGLKTMVRLMHGTHATFSILGSSNSMITPLSVFLYTYVNLFKPFGGGTVRNLPGFIEI